MAVARSAARKKYKTLHPCRDRRIHGEGEDRSFFYAHLRRPAFVHRGDRVWTGEPVGVVGETGNARTVGCHLHFEIHVRGHPVDPEPELQHWDRYS